MNDFVRMWHENVSLQTVVSPFLSHGLCDCFADFLAPLVLNHDARHPVTERKKYKSLNVIVLGLQVKFKLIDEEGAYCIGSAKMNENNLSFEIFFYHKNCEIIWWSNW